MNPPDMQRRQFFIALCASILFVSPQAFAAGGASSPRAVVEQLWGALIPVMREAQKLGYAGRHKRLKPVIEETHDLAAIAQIAAGQYWSQFTPDQRKRYVDAFTDLSIATYAERFDGYSGEQFKVVSERKLDNGDVVVQSTLAEPNGNSTRFDYVLRQREGRWSIVNIVADGVSDLAIKRAEYAGVLKAEGPEALIKRVQQKTADATKAK